MPDPIITLTTDFGEASPFVAAMKGVMLSINPKARLVDLSHQIPPQDVQHAAFFLAEAVPYFSPEAIHVVVVDPGVGTQRELLYVEVGKHRLLAPDNGVCALLARGRTVGKRIRLAKKKYWRRDVSPTFHGRDILAPVAAHLSLGIDPAKLGPAARKWVQLQLPEPVNEKERISGEVVFVDGFGNVITNIPGDLLPKAGPAKVKVEGHAVQRWVRSYGEAEKGELVALVSSGGLVEIAEVQGSAADRLGLKRGAKVRVWTQERLAGK
jgi:S-adenosylmethionine hydrolase